MKKRVITLIAILSTAFFTGCALTTKNEYQTELDRMMEIARSHNIEDTNPDFMRAFEEMYSDAYVVCADNTKSKECKSMISKIKDFLDTAIYIGRKEKELKLE